MIENVCVVGTGAAGWLSAFLLAKEECINKVTIIGSPSIPTIGVGESTSLVFFNVIVKLFGFKTPEYYNFIKETDATIKYGLSYEGWGRPGFDKFMHGFGPFYNDHRPFYNDHLNFYALGNFDPNSDYSEFFPFSKQIIYQNKFIEDYTEHKNYYSFHFDANKLISFFQNLSSSNKKIELIFDTVVDTTFKEDVLDELILHSGRKIKSEYYFNCTGERSSKQNVFKEEYIDYSDILLTDKALFCPIKFTIKEKEFTPYSVAKTMKYGWRWIVPTYSRRGTGYAFSSKHISVDQAIDEFRLELNDPKLEPNVISFKPRRAKQFFKKNYCSIGMASGFLEPLDAPGMSISLSSILYYISYIKNEPDHELHQINDVMITSFNFMAAFILLQYKTCQQDKSKFWIDHKNVKYDFYDELMNEYFVNVKETFFYEQWMFYNTIAGKGLRWNLIDKFKHLHPEIYSSDKLKVLESRSLSHLKYIDSIHNE